MLQRHTTSWTFQLAKAMEGYEWKEAEQMTCTKDTHAGMGWLTRCYPLPIQPSISCGPSDSQEMAGRSLRVAEAASMASVLMLDSHNASVFGLLEYIC